MDLKFNLKREKDNSGKYLVKPIKAETKEEVIEAVLDKEKVIFVVGRYRYDVKKDIKAGRLSVDDLSPDSRRKYFDDIKETLINRIAKALNISDCVTKELRNYKIKTNKKAGRCELIRVSGENKYNSKYDYISE